MREHVWKLASLVKRQKRRERWTRNGFQSTRRVVVDDFDMELIPDDRALVNDEVERQRRLAIISQQVGECVRKKTMRDLVEWHLFEKVPVSELAMAFEVTYVSAKSAVIRSKRYLGIVPSRIQRNRSSL
jgi:hypothetical protein